MEEINHHIEKHILQVLGLNQIARFSAMKPKQTDSNLYAYHLKRLIRLHYIVKVEGGYTLSSKGLWAIANLYADEENVLVTRIVSGILLKNEKDEILLTKRVRQPFINTWSLDLGKMYADEHSTASAAIRNLYEKSGARVADPLYCGTSYIRIKQEGYYLSSALAHLFIKHVRKSAIEPNSNSKWFPISEISQIELMPGALELINLVLAGSADSYENLIIEDGEMIYRRL